VLWIWNKTHWPEPLSLHFLHCNFLSLAGDLHADLISTKQVHLLLPEKRIACKCIICMQMSLVGHFPLPFQSPHPTAPFDLRPLDSWVVHFALWLAFVVVSRPAGRNLAFLQGQGLIKQSPRCNCRWHFSQYSRHAKTKKKEKNTRDREGVLRKSVLYEKFLVAVCKTSCLAIVSLVVVVLGFYCPANVVFTHSLWTV